MGADQTPEGCWRIDFEISHGYLLLSFDAIPAIAFCATLYCELHIPVHTCYVQYTTDPERLEPIFKQGSGHGSVILQGLGIFELKGDIIIFV